jgi:hypothetical protein
LGQQTQLENEEETQQASCACRRCMSLVVAWIRDQKGAVPKTAPERLEPQGCGVERRLSRQPGGWLGCGSGPTLTLTLSQTWERGY